MVTFFFIRKKKEKVPGEKKHEAQIIEKNSQENKTIARQTSATIEIKLWKNIDGMVFIKQ